MKRRRIILVLVSLLGALMFTGCQRSANYVESAALTETSQIFEVKGRLKSIATDGQSAVIEHETIPNYMPAMTMPFAVKDAGELEGLEHGAAIGFRFVVTENDSWIEQVKKLPEDAVAQSPAAERARLARISDRIPALEIGDIVPNFRLTNEDGERFQMSDFAGKDIVLTFIFVRCPVPNFCPLMSENFRKLQEMLQASGQAEDVQLISVTIDPEYDTPEVLKVYASRYTRDAGNWTFATGSAGEIDELTARFSVYIEPEAGTITHGLATAHISREGVLARIWRGNGWKPEEIFQALRPGSERTQTAETKPLPAGNQP